MMFVDGTYRVIEVRKVLGHDSAPPRRKVAKNVISAPDVWEKFSGLLPLMHVRLKWSYRFLLPR